MKLPKIAAAPVIVVTLAILIGMAAVAGVIKAVTGSKR